MTLISKQKTILKKNKIFDVISKKLDVQIRESFLFKIKCKSRNKNCALYRPKQNEKIKSSKLNISEIFDIKRLVVNIECMTSCTINYLLGLNKWRSINSYLKSNDRSIKNLIRREIQPVNVLRYLDDKSYIIPPSWIEGDKNSQGSNKKEGNLTPYYYPCNHDGVWSKGIRWEWVLRGTSCEKYWYCSSFWEKRFPGCNWVDGWNQKSWLWITVIYKYDKSN